jgi:uncharacterized membrane protein YuzA (DUF378 family)
VEFAGVSESRPEQTVRSHGDGQGDINMQNETIHMGRGTLQFLKVLTVLAAIGALNWGLVGFFNFNLVDAIFGGGAAEETSTASRVVYAIVGLAGLAPFFLLPGKRVDERHHTTTRPAI